MNTFRRLGALTPFSFNDALSLNNNNKKLISMLIYVEMINIRRTSVIISIL